MAHVRYIAIGAVIDFDHSEVTQISAHLGTGAAVAGALTAALAVAGVTASASIITAILGALLQLGSSALSGCNANQRGISLTVLWIGLPWCKAL